MRSLDHIDDLIEDKMREIYAQQFKGPEELVKEFVNTQTISDLHNQAISAKETWDSDSESLDIKPKKGIFKTKKIGKNLKTVMKIDNKKQKKIYEEKLKEFLEFQNK